MGPGEEPETLNFSKIFVAKKGVFVNSVDLNCSDILLDFQF